MQEWPDGEWDDDEDIDTVRERMRADEIAIMRRKLAETPPTGLDPADDYETHKREQWIAHIAAWDREHPAACDDDHT